MSPNATAGAALAVASLALVLRKRAQARAPMQCTQCEANGGEVNPQQDPRHHLKANDSTEVPSDPRQDPRHHLNRRFFADTDKAGLVRCDLRLVDRFLSLDCGHELLRLGLFPNAQEISESMACLQAAIEHLQGVVSLSDNDVVALVVGDGRTPRTAALLAMRTRWTVLSVDPALEGLLPTGEVEAQAEARVEARVEAQAAVSAQAQVDVDAEAQSSERCAQAASRHGPKRAARGAAPHLDPKLQPHPRPDQAPCAAQGAAPRAAGRAAGERPPAGSPRAAPGRASTGTPPLHVRRSRAGRGSAPGCAAATGAPR